MTDGRQTTLQKEEKEITAVDRDETILDFTLLIYTLYFLSLSKPGVTWSGGIYCKLFSLPHLTGLPCCVVVHNVAPQLSSSSSPLPETNATEQ